MRLLILITSALCSFHFGAIYSPQRQSKNLLNALWLKANGLTVTVKKTKQTDYSQATARKKMKLQTAFSLRDTCH